jgi:hypothetical protein
VYRLAGLLSTNAAFQGWLARVKFERALNKLAPGAVFRKDLWFWNLAELTGNSVDGLQRIPSYHIASIDEQLSQTSTKRCTDQELYDELANVAALDEALGIIESHDSREHIEW